MHTRVEQCCAFESGCREPNWLDSQIEKLLSKLKQTIRNKAFFLSLLLFDVCRIQIDLTTGIVCSMRAVHRFKQVILEPLII